MAIVGAAVVAGVGRGGCVVLGGHSDSGPRDRGQEEAVGVGRQAQLQVAQLREEGVRVRPLGEEAVGVRSRREDQRDRLEEGLRGLEVPEGSQSAKSGLSL